MKKVSEHIDQEIRQTLAALDGIRKTSPKPYFYSRLQARMQAGNPVKEVILSINPVWIKVIVSIVAFLILVNVYTVSTVQKPGTLSIQKASTDEIQTLIVDYYPQNPSVYNLDAVINQ